MSAESAIMNPSQLIIALRAQGRTLQVKKKYNNPILFFFIFQFFIFFFDN